MQRTPRGAADPGERNDMPKRKSHARLMLARDLGAVEPDIRQHAHIAGLCPGCDYAGTLHRPAESDQVECGLCGWKTPYVETMRHSFDPKKGHPPLVYYMRMGTLVKIGTTTNLERRVEALTPQGVMAVEFGSYELEHQRHQQFAATHSHGEWFELSENLAAHIVDLRETFTREQGQPVDDWIAQWLPVNAPRPGMTC